MRERTIEVVGMLVALLVSFLDVLLVGLGHDCALGAVVV